MIRKLSLVILPVLGALLLGTSTASAQFSPFPQTPTGINKWFPPGNHHYHVMYRQPLWKSKTFHCPLAAHQHVVFLRSQGYEAHLHYHGGQLGVRYRFLNWREYTTTFSHAQAHRIVNQLRFQGFQAKVSHH